MADRRIEYVPLESLVADPRNPKSHDLATIDSSYTRFGVVDLITVDERTGYIASGHGRTTALRDAFARGEEVPEGVRVDPETGGWLVPATFGWASKNDTEAAAALIAMNRVTEMGGWVDESLLELLQELSDSGAGFEGVGFSETDLDDLKHLMEDAPDLDALADEWDPDNVPNSGSGSSVTIKLTDPAVIELWHTTRDAAKNDDEAARVIFGLEPAPPVAKAKRKGRGDEPSLTDLDTDATTAGLSAADAVLAGLAPDAETVAESAVSTPMETPVDNSGDDGLDWSTAGMGAPEPEAGDEAEFSIDLADLGDGMELEDAGDDPA